MSTENVLRKIRGYIENSPSIPVDDITDGYVVGGRYDSDPSVRFEVGAGHEHGYRPILQIVSDADGERFEKIGRSYMDIDGFSGGAVGLTKDEYTGIRRAS